MELKIDIKKLCENLSDADENNMTERICETDGERYLYENVVKPCVTGTLLRKCDIDFSAFSEDDIVSIIDYKSEMINDALFTVANVADVFGKSKALTVSEHRFF